MLTYNVYTKAYSKNFFILSSENSYQLRGLYKVYFFCSFYYKNNNCYCFGFQITKLGASLVAQWLRICLPMQGTRVQALVWEDLTCRGATKPVRHNY